MCTDQFGRTPLELSVSPEVRELLRECLDYERSKQLVSFARKSVVLATSDSDTTLESLRANPVTSDLDAVRKKRVVVVPAALVNRAGPRIAQGLEAIARALHPDAFR